MKEPTEIKIQLGQEEFSSDEAADAAKVFTEGNRQLIRNYMAQIMTDMCQLSLADLGEKKFIEIRARCQGEIAACNYLLNVSSMAISANQSNQ